MKESGGEYYACGSNCKGHLYGIRDLVHTYKCGDNSFMQHMQGSYSHAQDSMKINRLWKEFCQSNEKMHVFQSLIFQFLLLEVWNIIHQRQQPDQQQ